MSEPTNVTGTPATAPPPPKPALPPKPAAPAKTPAKGGKDRRFFLVAMFGSWFAIAWTSFMISMIGMLLGTVRFLFPNVLSLPPTRVKAGPPDQYEEGKVVDRFKDQNFWIVRYNYPGVGDIIYALSTTCTHLGCTPNWLEREEKFKCPCHGSGFKITGINFEGPAPRPLERWGIAVEEGQIIVDKSKKFQYEMGAWDNKDSYIKL